MTFTFKHPVIGQEAVVAYGLGRVTGYRDEFPFQHIKVQTYIDKIEREYSPHNVALVAINYVTGKCAYCYIAELEAKYAAECDASMMAGSQNSALRLQLRDAEERASRWAKIADQRAIEVADLKVALAKHSLSATERAS